MTKDTTPESLARVRAGDRGAFEALFHAWYPRLVDYAMRLLRAQDPAEDAVQDVFVALWRRHADLPDAAKLPAYLHRAVRNRALNQLRSAKTASAGPIPPGAEPEVAPVAEERLEEEEVAAILSEALAGLSPRCREVFMLSREQGLTYPAIADTLGISVKTVETLMGRALQALRTTLRPRLDARTADH